jgi:predicted PhzF superfamily epimerase YddE/YHI9
MYHIDAFTDRVFGGNPAAVVLLDDWLPDSVLAAIAAENNLPETAFVIARGEVMPLRWLTPTVEVDLCGHATLAAAHVILNHVRPAAASVTFSTRSGNLMVTRDRDMLSMDFPARPGQPIEITGDLCSALGERPSEVYLARDLLAIYADESRIRKFQPDFRRIESLPAFALIISAPGDTADYVYRFFAPCQGIPEDPATGSANCTLVPYWTNRLGKPDLTANQLSARGGALRCSLRGERVLIAGRTVEYLQGEITI